MRSLGFLPHFLVQGYLGVYECQQHGLGQFRQLHALDELAVRAA
jgi:hypothetical protein